VDSVKVCIVPKLISPFIISQLFKPQSLHGRPLGQYEHQETLLYLILIKGQIHTVNFVKLKVANGLSLD
jgi:hypothetical protein